jgi:hypothetical protein
MELTNDWFNRLVAAEQEKTTFPSANVDGLGHALGLTADDQTLLSLGFEDLPNLGNRDFNDVIASWSLQEGVFSIGSTVLLDPTADRLPDLALGSRAGSPSTALIITTNSGEIQRTWQPFGADDWSGLQLGAGDVNGDGFDDLVAVREFLASDSAGGLGCEGQVLLGQSAPDPKPPRTSSFRAFGGAISGPMSLAVRDLDLDGYAEVVVTASQADPQRRVLALEVWSADASGTFRRRTDLSLPSTAALDPGHGYSVALGDLDGNGSVELVLGDLQGGDLFVGSIDPGSVTPSPPIPPTVLQPYGKGFSSGVLPTVISAQQTLLQRPQGLDDKALPWVVGAPSGSNQALLSGLGTPGALIVKSADPRDPRPAQVPLGWLAGADARTAPLIAIPWDSRDGAPVFASAGVSYLAPAISSSKPVKLTGSPRPILVSAAAGTTGLNLMAGPEVDAAAGQWQQIAGSTNTIINSSTGSAAGWTNPWTAESKSSSDPASNRDKYNQVSVPLVSYTPPFLVNVNPLSLADPGQLLEGLSVNASSYIQDVIKPWNAQHLKDASPTTWGPGAPNSSNTPYGSPQPNPSLPSFKPAFTTLPPGPAHAGVVEQFQQRLISVAMAGMAINYQHHYSPFWYGPQSWVDGKPTVQVDYLTSPELRQTQGIDCTNFTSWNYNDAFGFWINSDTADQAKETEVEVDWLTGDTTLQAEVVTTATEIYAPTSAGSPPDKRTVIERLNRHLRPGDLLYLNPSPVNENPKDATPENASHGITWINDNSSTDGLIFVSLPSSSNSTAGGSTAGSSAGGSPTQRPAFIIDSTGSESFDFQHQYYPNGVQIRQFDENAWYVNNVITVHRWLTPDNVRRMDEALRSLSNVDVQPPGTTPVKGAFNFNNSSDRSKTFLLDMDSTNLNGKLYDPNLLPKTGDFKLTLNKGGFSGDLPAQSSSKDVIKLQFLNDGSKQDVAMIEEVSNERGEMETIAGSARGILSGVVNNYIHTRGGDDEIIGSAGVDYIRAGTGDDIIDGGAGNDVVRSGTGNDRITLGAGADKLLITRDQLAGKDTLLDFSAEDSLVLSDGISVLAALGSNTLTVGLANGFFQELVLAGTSLLTWNPAMVTTV